ncbi:hypothetical protein GC163_22045 [bacterium]|nr:hypothetical protein [bacterium]
MQSKLSGRAILVALMSVIVSAAVWWTLLTDLMSYPGGPPQYGFPLTYRLDLAGIAERFYPQACAFDLVIAGITIVATGYTTGKVAAKSSWVVCIAFLSCGVLMLFLGWCRSDFALSAYSPLLPLLLFFSVMLLLALWPVSLIFTGWHLGCRYLGQSFAAIVPVALVGILIGMSVLCEPQDLYFNPTREDIPSLVELLSDESPRVRSYAVSLLQRFCPLDKPTAQAIIRAMSDPDQMVSSNAISLASDLGPERAAAIPLLIEKFLETDCCVHELGEMNGLAKEAIPALKSRLPGAEGYLKLSICQALWKIERNTDEVVPALIQLLDDEFDPLRCDAAELLGRIGSPAKAALPRLQEMVANVTPSREPQPPPLSTNGEPMVVAATEADFYPRIRQAAQTALERIKRSDESSVP